jgi:formylglycine-generating enzyme required for sulfatase activity
MIKTSVKAIVLALLTVSSVKANIYYVNIHGFAGNDLSATIIEARNNPGIDTVYVGLGIYKLNTQLIIEDVVIGGCVADVSGGIIRKYPGAVNNQRSQQTILDGNSLVLTLPSQKHRVATINAGGILEGCVIRNGHARGTTNSASDMSGNGGGVLVNGGKLHNCIVRGNVAMNVKHSASNPSRGGGVFITENGGDVVNCIIAFNMDHYGLGVDGDSGAIVNNTIARNANTPKYVFIRGNINGTPEYRHYTHGTSLVSTMAGPYIRLDSFYMAATETTFSQYACFLAAIDLDASLAINQADWKEMCSGLTPSAGYTSVPIATFLGLQPNEISTPSALISTGTTGFHIAINGNAGSGSEVFYSNKVSSAYKAGTTGNVSYPDDPLVRDNFPIANVSWFGSLAFCLWTGGCLPTDAQWEYAARKTLTDIQTAAAFAGGETVINNIAWNIGNSGSNTHEVALLNPTPLGLYDMNGNIAEWLCDWNNNGVTSNGAYPIGTSVLVGSATKSGSYTVSTAAGTNGSDPENPLYNPVYNYPDRNRIVRGGCWYNDASFFTLSARWGGYVPTNINNLVGFRSCGFVE